MLEEVAAMAMKRVIAWQIESEMKAQHLTKTMLASAAAALGKKFKFELAA